MKGIILLLCLIMTTAQAELCAVNEHVDSVDSDFVCTACPVGRTNPVRDDTTGTTGASGFTSATSCLCAVNEHKLNHECIQCPAGRTNAAGDDPDVYPVNTNCDPTLCAVNKYVSTNACVACAAGTTNAANDDASGQDTTCDVPCSHSDGLSGCDAKQLEEIKQFYKLNPNSSCKK
jgi:hypothetical protein